MQFATQSAQVATNQVRVDTLNGRDHLVAPVVAVREMVLKGELLPAEEIEAAAPAFNGRPLPVGHPQDDAGNFVSANSRDIWETDVVGWFFETEFDSQRNALVGEVWVDIDKSAALGANDSDLARPAAYLAAQLDDAQAANVASRLGMTVNADDTPMEVSTAYWYAPQSRSGTFDGTEYSATQHGLKPDHLALLPNATGECSVEDGCGVYPDGVQAQANVIADGAQPSDSDSGGDDVDATFMSKFRHALNRAGLSTSDGACGCGCSESHDEDTMNYDELSEQTGISVDTLEAMSDDEIERVTELASDDGARNGGDDEQTNDNTDDVPSAELDALRSEIADLRESLEAQERDKRQDALDTLSAHSDVPDDVLENMGTDELVAFASEFDTKPADYGALNMGGRRSSGSNSSDEMSGRAARLGAMSTDGDD